ncbi:inositol monophosphatase family protein [Phytohabitans kaempferiae]|uniref:Inositol monophosphatase family protein n=1 Tax=Phytohabitans kaempferiae TaxID=1620943 RepID=A0ABV6M195_9ACTN
MRLDSLWDTLEVELLEIFRHYRTRLDTLDIDTKPDATLLTEADIAVEKLIVTRLRELDRNAVIVAEEDDRAARRQDVLTSPESVWVIDPIDGTAEFVRPDRVEFCSVVCLLRHRTPVAAFVLAPEVGTDRRPITVTADSATGTVLVNRAAAKARAADQPRAASVTRSGGVPPRPFEEPMLRAGYELKTRTTSQTLDMVRTALDLSDVTGGKLRPFRLFHRRQQKVWDGLAGLCIGEATGLLAVDTNGHNRLPVDIETLSQPEPTFDATTMGSPEEVKWFLGIT